MPRMNARTRIMTVVPTVTAPNAALPRRLPTHRLLINCMDACRKLVSMMEMQTGYVIARSLWRCAAVIAYAMSSEESPDVSENLKSKMKKIGLIGGLSWVSTAEYYKRINEL